MSNKLQTNLHGCGAHGCLIQKPTGQGTNAGCLCRPSVLHVRIDEYQRAWQQQAQRIAELEAALCELLEVGDFDTNYGIAVYNRAKKTMEAGK
jgi:hypothetical protein